MLGALLREIKRTEERKREGERETIILKQKKGQPP